jgi:phospholipid transport system substrate-binding protein
MTTGGIAGGKTIMRTRHLLRGLALLLLASLAAPCHAAEPPGAPSAFVAELAHQALLPANSRTLSSADRRRRLEALLDEDFDVPRIARFVLGRYWRMASNTERQKFTAVFRDFIVQVYSQRFTDYDGESFRVIGQRAEGAASTLVYTEISQLSSGQPVKVEWRVIDKDGYRIIDMSVAGISMALAQREEFASALERNGGDLPSLIRQMQAKMSAQQSR